MMKKEYILLGLFVLLLSPLFAQNDTLNSDIYVVKAIVVEGDTILYSDIKEVVVFKSHQFKNRRERRRYNRLIRNVKKVYPYAVIARDKLREVNDTMLTMNERQRKIYMKQVEDELREEFEGELKRLTITQGRILIKLIDRETGDTSYELVKELRGSFSAFFWQALARIFGSNLKTTFDAEGEDKMINEIIIMLENGQL